MTPRANEHPVRRTDELHKGRTSIPGARYFVTFVTEHRKIWLGDHPAAHCALATLREWHRENDGAVLCAIVMPDHVHVLFELGQRLTVGQCIGRWKSHARRTAAYAGDFQRDFFEHRLLPDESSEDYGLYIFLNPYRAQLIPPSAVWPWWWAPDPRRFRFAELIAETGSPPREWLGWPDEHFAHLSTGE